MQVAGVADPCRSALGNGSQQAWGNRDSVAEDDREGYDFAELCYPEERDSSALSVVTVDAADLRILSRKQAM